MTSGMRWTESPRTRKQREGDENLGGESCHTFRLKAATEILASFSL